MCLCMYMSLYVRVCVCVCLSPGGACVRTFLHEQLHNHYVSARKAHVSAHRNIRHEKSVSDGYTLRRLSQGEATH